MNTHRIPALFVSHGSPMLALDPGETGPALAAWGRAVRALPLRAVLVMSPHWMARDAAVMAAAAPETWHDFGGFPEPLYRLQYPAPGSPELAQEVLARLAAQGVASHADAQRPFDHGAWIPLSYLLPDADLPVVQLALPAGAGPREVYAMGRAVAGLRDEGVLVVGSGSMTHNLREFFGGRPEQAATAAPYVEAFARWVEETLQAGDRERLFDYREHAPHAVRAHPTDEHFLPIFFALGAAGWGEPGGGVPDYITREIMYSYLAMDAFAMN